MKQRKPLDKRNVFPDQETRDQETLDNLAEVIYPLIDRGYSLRYVRAAVEIVLDNYEPRTE